MMRIDALARGLIGPGVTFVPGGCGRIFRGVGFEEE